MRHTAGSCKRVSEKYRRLPLPRPPVTVGQLGMGEPYTTLANMLGAILLLNLADLVLTLHVVLTGAAVESNPVMAAVLAISPTVFGASKMALVSLGVALLWRLRQHAAAHHAGRLCLVAYGGVLVFHLVGA